MLVLLAFQRHRGNTQGWHPVRILCLLCLSLHSVPTAGALEKLDTLGDLIKSNCVPGFHLTVLGNS